MKHKLESSISKGIIKAVSVAMMLFFMGPGSGMSAFAEGEIEGSPEPVASETAEDPAASTDTAAQPGATVEKAGEVLDAEGSVVTVDAPAKADDMDFVVTGEGEVEFDEVNKVLIVKSGNVTVSMKEGVTETTQSIEVAGNNVGLVIDSLTINAPKQAIKINSDASVTLTLEGTSTLTGGDGYAAVEPVYESTEKMASLTIEGDGTLNVTGGTDSAGIGGSKKTLGVYGNITIKSGVINANSGNHSGWTGAAAIGSSDNPANGTSTGSYKYVDSPWGVITIDGGTVTARADYIGAGIGGGNHCDSGVVVINGGTVDAQGHTGIGCGYGSSRDSGNGGDKGPGYYYADVTITGGTVLARALDADDTNFSGAGIGGGEYSDAKITIKGGNVTAYGANSKVSSWHHGGAGIGSGVGADKVEITISDGIIKAWGGASDKENKRGGAGIGSGYSGTTSGESSKYFVETDTSVTISNGTVLAVGGWGASGIGSGADNETAKSITIADAATIEAYADGTKFAIDTRDPSKSGIDGESCSIDETQYPRNYTGVLLQGTFVFPGEINGLEQDTEGLAPLVVTNDLTGEKKTLTQMPEGYRSFATDVSAAGNYTVFTNDKQISDGKGRYFNVCASETYDESKVTERNVLYRAVDNDLCDNYFLFPVKVIVIEKKIEAESDVNITGLNTTVYFALWAGGDGGHYVTQEADGSGDMWVEIIEIKDGVPQSKAYFVNVVDGEYAITEIASATDGSYLKAGTAFGNYELAKIETTHDGASGDNDGKIDKDQWTDEVTVTNTFKAGSTSVTLGGKKSFTGWPADVEAPVFTYTLSENGSVIDSKTTKGAGDYQFDTITYTETGTHLYTVEETRGRVHGVTYDTRIYNITVEVFNDGSTGKLETKIIGDSNTGTDLDFINTYKAEPTPTPVPDPTPATWDHSKSKTATNLDSNYESEVTLSMPSAEEQLVSDIVFVLDKSSCREETASKAETLLDDLKNSLGASGAKAKIAVIAFDGTSHVLQGLTEFTGTDAEIATIRGYMAANSIPSAEHVGGTNMHAGLLAADQMLSNDSEVTASRKYVVMVSDGLTRLFTGSDGKVKDIYWQTTHEDFTGNYANFNPKDAVYYGMIGEWSIARSGVENYGLPYGDWSTYLAYVNQWVAADGDTYAEDFLTYGNDATSMVKNPATGEITDSSFSYVPYHDYNKHALSVDRAVYEAYNEYVKLTNAGIRCFAVNVGTSDFGNAFMAALNGISGTTGADFSMIHNDILYLLGAGSTVDDYMGFEDGDYNFDLISPETMTLTIDNTNTGSNETYTAEVIGTNHYGFVKQNDGTYKYEVTYYPEDKAEHEHFIWEMNVPVSNFEHVSLKYKVKLMNPKTAAGTYGEYDKDGSQGKTTLYTNSKAVLNVIDSEGNAGRTEEFAKPTVSYTVSSTPTPSPTPTASAKPSVKVTTAAPAKNLVPITADAIHAGRNSITLAGSIFCAVLAAIILKRH